MDGNGRWAKKRALPRQFGHKAGVKTLMSVLENCFDLGVKYVSVYAFSTENWNRPQGEVDALLDLFRTYFTKQFSALTDKKIKINVWGDKSKFPDDIKNAISEVENTSISEPKGVFNIALSYGGRREIVDAVNRAVKEGKEVDENIFGSYLYSANVPDPDLIVRTGGEMRISNFLLYQCAYSELYFSKTLWPDFSKKELVEIFEDYSLRDRRFGKVK
jgi:undecaprenyl diphosphate synthase